MRHHARASIVLAFALPAACLPAPPEHQRGGFALDAPDALHDDLTAAPRHLRALEEATDHHANLVTELLREGLVAELLREGAVPPMPTGTRPADTSSRRSDPT